MIKFILKKDLPTIKAGRIFVLSNDGLIGVPIVMDIEREYLVKYEFPVNVLNDNPDWFEEFEFNPNEQPTMNV